MKPGKLSEVAALLLSPWEREDSMLRVAKFRWKMLAEGTGILEVNLRVLVKHKASN